MGNGYLGINKHRLSIKLKAVAFILVMVVVMFATLGGVCYLVLGNILAAEAAQTLNNSAQKYSAEIDNQLYRAEDLVTGVDTYITENLGSAQDIADIGMRNDLQKGFEEFFVSSAGNDPYIISCYMTFNPEIVGDGTQGFLYCRNYAGMFEESEVTDVLAFSEGNMNEVGWFYHPLENREAMWIDPYYCPACDAVVISYVVPVYKDNVLVGVAGVDMGMEALINYASGFNVAGGEAFLKSKDGTVHFHKDYLDDSGNIHGDIVDDITENADKMSLPKTDDIVIRLNHEGKDSVMAFDTLENGMKLVVCAECSEVFASKIVLLRWLVAFAVILSIMMIGVTYYYANKITGSLKELTDASNRIANGDFRVNLPEIKSDDEIADLTRSIRAVINSLKNYTVDMESKAYVDQMTKVKNKSAYNSTVESLDEQIKDGVARFAVVMCDLNYLKVINDKYGHNAGDDAITKAAQIICEHFPLSSVFRTGGDEFVVILTGRDFKVRQKLISDFTEHLKRLDSNPNNINNISISFGASEFHAGEDPDYNTVFRRADDRMYLMKQDIHKKHGTGLR